MSRPGSPATGGGGGGEDEKGEEDEEEEGEGVGLGAGGRREHEKEKEMPLEYALWEQLPDVDHQARPYHYHSGSNLISEFEADKRGETVACADSPLFLFWFESGSQHRCVRSEVGENGGGVDRGETVHGRRAFFDGSVL